MLTMEQCIRETPIRMMEIVENHQNLFKEVVKNRYQKIIITGSGSSYHAGVAAKECMLKYMQIPVEVLYFSKFSNYISNRNIAKWNKFKYISCYEKGKETRMPYSIYVG